jgi:hypothetical protein
LTHKFARGDLAAGSGWPSIGGNLGTAWTHGDVTMVLATHTVRLNFHF